MEHICLGISGPVLKRSSQPDSNRGSQVLVNHPNKPKPEVGHQRGPQTPAPRFDEKPAPTGKPILKEAFLVDPEDLNPKPKPDHGSDGEPVGERRNQPGQPGLLQMFNAFRSAGAGPGPGPGPRPKKSHPPQRNQPQPKNDRPPRPNPQPKPPGKKRPPPPKQVRPPPIRNGKPKRPKNSHPAPKPSSSYGAPKAPIISDSYGAPKAPVVADSYGAPQAPIVADSYGAPQAPVVEDSYGSPKAPAESYNSPPAPPAAYSGSQDSYSSPQSVPETNYQPAQDSYGSPPQQTYNSVPNLTPDFIPNFESSQKDPTPPSVLKPSSPSDGHGGLISGFLPTATRNNFDESISEFARPEPEKFSFFDDNELPSRSDQLRPGQPAKGELLFI